jgi:hypothetical protein
MDTATLLLHITFSICFTPWVVKTRPSSTDIASSNETPTTHSKTSGIVFTPAGFLARRPSGAAARSWIFMECAALFKPCRLSAFNKERSRGFVNPVSSLSLPWPKMHAFLEPPCLATCCSHFAFSIQRSDVHTCKQGRLQMIPSIFSCKTFRL